jgi:putative N-acetyltransferase (TIGR04045 family)
MFDELGFKARLYRHVALVTEVATEPWQLRAYHQLRTQVFVEEQGMFTRTDEDAHDEAALPIVSMTTSCGVPDQVVGTVRIFQRAGDPKSTWYGGRLAVEASFRRHGHVGEALITAAVCTAHALGCETFLATVQPGVVRYFERRHFAVIGHLTLCGVEHALMQSELRFYPPKFHGSLNVSGLPRRASLAPEAA